MKNLTTLETRIQAMLNGERKRREVALAYIEALEESVHPVIDAVNQYDFPNVAYEFVPGLYLKKFHTTDVCCTALVTDLWESSLVSDLHGSEFWSAMRTLLANMPKLLSAINAADVDAEAITNIIK